MSQTSDNALVVLHSRQLLAISGGEWSRVADAKLDHLKWRARAIRYTMCPTRCAMCATECGSRATRRRPSPPAPVTLARYGEAQGEAAEVLTLSEALTMLSGRGMSAIILDIKDGSPTGCGARGTAAATTTTTTSIAAAASSTAQSRALITARPPGHHRC